MSLVWTSVGDIDLSDLTISDRFVESDSGRSIITEFRRGDDIVRRDEMEICKYRSGGISGLSNSSLRASDAVHILMRSPQLFAWLMDGYKASNELIFDDIPRNELEVIDIVDARDACRNVHSIWSHNGLLVANGCHVNFYAGHSIKPAQGKVA